MADSAQQVPQSPRDDAMHVDEPTDNVLISHELHSLPSLQEKLNYLAVLLGLEDAATPAELLSKAVDSIEQLKTQVPKAHSQRNLLWQETLTPQQISTLEDINEAFKEEYKARRVMMIKRLDVTLQSLLWSPRLKNKDIGADAISRRRQLLALGEPHHSLFEIYLAQDDLTEMKKTSAQSSVANSAVSKFSVSTVVDRGGRIHQKLMEQSEAAIEPGSKKRQTIEVSDTPSSKKRKYARVQGTWGGNTRNK